MITHRNQQSKLSSNQYRKRFSKSVSETGFETTNETGLEAPPEIGFETGLEIASETLLKSVIETASETINVNFEGPRGPTQVARPDHHEDKRQARYRSSNKYNVSGPRPSTECPGGSAW